MNQMAGMGGLLDSMPQQQTGQGLLSGAPKGGSSQHITLAMKLSQNPTQATAQAIVKEMQAQGDPSAEQFAAIFEQAGDNPQQLKRIADMAIANLQGQ